MSVVVTRPSSTVGTPLGSVVGASTLHEALSDDSDSSYLEATGEFNGGVVDLPAPSLPAGAVIKRVDVQVRVARTLNIGRIIVTANFGQPSQAAGQTDVSWTSPASFTLSMSPALMVPVGRLSFQLNSISGYHGLRLYEAAVEYVYVELPATSVTAPSGTVTDTNRPTVTWSNTLDADGGPQTHYEVRVFDESTYTDGGFSPDTAPAVAKTGLLAGDASSWQVDTVLAEGNYRAYVRVAQTVNGAPFTSPWAYEEFEIDVDVPAAPLIDATGDDANGRIVLTITDQPGDATTDAIEVQRSLDGGTTWEPLRLTTDTAGVIDDPAAWGTLYDYEAPNGVEVFYRARALHDYNGVYAASSWAQDSDSWAAAVWWLKHPHRPELNMIVTVRQFDAVNRPARQGVFTVLGARNPVVIEDARGGETGTIVLRTDSAGERAALDALLEAGGVFLLQPDPAHGEPERYVTLGDYSRQRVSQRATAPERFEQFTWVEVDQPVGPVVGWPS